jgi:hypothetical protein
MMRSQVEWGKQLKLPAGCLAFLCPIYPPRRDNFSERT